MIQARTILVALTPLFATACGGSGFMPDVTRLIEPSVIVKTDEGAPDATPGTCWAKVVNSNVETITERVIVQPAEISTDGTVITPAIHREVTRPVNGDGETWFERPCEAQVTPQLTESLQRALKARGFYAGEITGEMDLRTRLAIRAYQQPQGIDSGVLSLSAAKQLGLIQVEIDQAKG